MITTKAEVSIQEPGAAPTDWSRIRFAACVALYGSALGAAAVLVNFLSQDISPVYDTERMSLARSLVFATGGALAGIVVTAPAAYWLYGSRRTFSTRRRKSRGFFVWAVLGAGYGFVFPLVMGGFFLPFSGYILDWSNGILSVPDILIENFDLITGRWIPLALVFGAGRLFFTSLIAGAVFWPGAWLIDKFNASAHPATARYGSWAMAVGLSGLVIAFAAFAPELTLSKLG